MQFWQHQCTVMRGRGDKDRLLQHLPKIRVFPLFQTAMGKTCLREGIYRRLTATRQPTASAGQRALCAPVRLDKFLRCLFTHDLAHAASAP